MGWDRNRGNKMIDVKRVRLSVAKAGLLVWCAVLPASPARGEAAADKAERDALLGVCEAQVEAVVAMNEAMMTAQAAARARGYVAAWTEQPATWGELAGAELVELEKRIGQIERRFVTLYAAHFGTGRDRKRKEVAPSAEAKRLAEDAKARAAAREQLSGDIQSAHCGPQL